MMRTGEDFTEYDFELLGQFPCPHCGVTCDGGFVVLDELVLGDGMHVRTCVIHAQPVCRGFELEPRQAEELLKERGLWPPAEGHRPVPLS